jgi:O-antigen ligase
VRPATRQRALASSGPDPRQSWGAPPILPTAALVAGLGVAVGLLAVVAAGGSPSYRAALLVGAALPIVATLFGGARRMLLAAIAFDVPLQMDRFFDYHQGPGDLGALGGFSLSLTTFAVLCLWTLRLVEGPRLPPGPRPEVRRTALPLCLLVLASALSVTVAGDRALALFQVAMLAQSLLVFLYVAIEVRERRDLLLITTFLALGAVLEGVLAVTTLVGLPALNADGIETRVDHSGGLVRFGGTIGSPNNAASVLAMLLVISLALLLAPGGRRRRVLAGMALGLGGLALILTQARAGWLAFGVGLLLFVAVAVRRRWLRVRVTVNVVAIVVVFAALFGGLVATRLTANDHGTAQSRVPLLYTAAREAGNHPILGVGVNNEVEASAPYRTRDIAYQWNYTVHNSYLLTLAETGIVGLVPLLWFLAAGLRQGLRATRARDPVLRLLALGLTAALAGHIVNGLFESAAGRADVQGLWLVVALITAIASITAVSDEDGGRRRSASPEPAAPPERVPA